MRTLVSGAIGAVASAAAWLALQHFTQVNLSWLVCLVGVVTGMCVHRAGGHAARESFGRGALATVLTLAAIVGGWQVYATIMETSSQASNVAAVQPIDSLEQGERAAGAESAEVELPEPEVEEPAPFSGGGTTRTSMKTSFSEIDMLWMGLAALAAYVTGKGTSSSVASTVAVDDQQDLSASEGDTPQGDDSP